MTGWRAQYNINHDCYFKIPYSSHSSGRELLQFVKAIRPKKLKLNLKCFTDSPAAMDFQLHLIQQSVDGQQAKREQEVAAKMKTQQKLSFNQSARPTEYFADEEDPKTQSTHEDYLMIGQLCGAAKLPTEIYRADKVTVETPSTAVQTPKTVKNSPSKQMAVKDAVTITYIDRDDEDVKASQENTIDLEKKSPSGLGISIAVKKAALTNSPSSVDSPQKETALSVPSVSSSPEKPSGLRSFF